MKLNPYLIFNGQCREAFLFYEQCLGGKIAYMATFGEAPPDQQLPAAMRDRIMHAMLMFDDNMLMASDAPSDKPQPASSTHLAVEAVTPEKAESLFASLSEGAHVTMPLGETFWAYRFGMLTDRFGIPWMISAGKPMEPPAA